MNMLLPKMLQSYAAHPSFHFDRSPLPPDSQAVETFERVYNALQQRHPPLSPASSADHLAQCEVALARVFDALSAGCADAMERRFLVELRGECLRLLREEAGHFAATQPDDATTGAKGMQLRGQRHYFGLIPQSAVEEMLDAGAADLEVFERRARQGMLRRDELSTNTGASVDRIAAVLNREFKADGTLDAVSRYVGRTMCVRGLALELSVPQATWWQNGLPGLARAAHTLYAHIDESLIWPKSIVYLSPVGPENGPTSCYPGIYEALTLHPLQELIGRVVGSVGNAEDSPLRSYYGKQYHQSTTSERFRRHFMLLPEALRFNSHLGWDVLPDSPFEAALVSTEKSMTGPAGTFIVFDGARLFHRGGLMQSGKRIALQVIFGSKLTLGSRIIGKIKRAVA